MPSWARPKTETTLKKKETTRQSNMNKENKPTQVLTKQKSSVTTTATPASIKKAQKMKEEKDIPKEKKQKEEIELPANKESNK